jgi:hypothetical protein
MPSRPPVFGTARSSAPAASARSRSTSSIESPPHNIDSATDTSASPGEQPRARCLTGRRPPTGGAVSIAASNAGISSIRRTSSPTTADPPNGVNVSSSARISTRETCRKRPARARSDTRLARRLAFAPLFTDKVRPPRSTETGATHAAKPPGRTHADPSGGLLRNQGLIACSV